MTPHNPDEISEDQRAAIQDWTRALKQRKVRNRDIQENIERVEHHVNGLILSRLMMLMVVLGLVFWRKSHLGNQGALLNWPA